MQTAWYQMHECLWSVPWNNCNKHMPVAEEDSDEDNSSDKDEDGNIFENLFDM